jgi:ribonucleoside-diphosphate reductase alpha chain
VKPLTDNARLVLERRYLAPGEDPQAMIARVARAVAAADRLYGALPEQVAAAENRFRARMQALEFLPNSPTLMNAGRPLGQLAACFVVPVEDSTEAIFDAIKWAALIQKTGGGTGFSFSRLRPAGDTVDSTGGVAGGPVSFIDAFDTATAAVKQGGTRRGANMGVLRVDHPDIFDFITVKLDLTRMRNFNLSVAVTDDFMRAVRSGDAYALVNPRTGQVVRHLDARRVFQLIVDVAWQTGDPGLLFIDRINEDNPTPSLGVIEATNPCGEQPLLPFESCVLGSINLSQVARGKQIDWDRFRDIVRDGVHFLDNLIDCSRYPLPQIEAITRANRKIGLGVMGLADLLIELNVPYDSDEAVSISGEIARTLESESLAASEELAGRRGAFANLAQSRWSGRPLRNATTTTIAPTGTISIIAGCSSGIEPLYAVAFERRVLDGEVLLDLHPAFERLARTRGFWSPQLADELKTRGRVRGLASVPEDVQQLFATAHDVSSEFHLRMQAAFQKHSHSGVSKTVNLPNRATPDDVRRVYTRAHELGCKGVTVYRDGCRGEQVLAFGGHHSEANDVLVTSGSTTESCPECGARLRHAGGCRACSQCGWSVCV